MFSVYLKLFQLSRVKTSALGGGLKAEQKCAELDHHHGSVCAKQDASDDAHAGNHVDVHFFLARNAFLCTSA